MKDTPAAIEQKFRRMLLERSGEERLKMGCSMHATALALVEAGLRQKHPTAGPAELKGLLFLHVYGADFKPEERNRIASALGGGNKPKRPRVRNDIEPRNPPAHVKVAERPAGYRIKYRSTKKK